MLFASIISAIDGSRSRIIYFHCFWPVFTELRLPLWCPFEVGAYLSEELDADGLY